MKNKKNSFEKHIDQRIKVATKLHIAGEFDQAKSIYEEVICKHPNHFDAIQLLGALFVQKGDYQKSRDLLVRALCLNKSLPSVHNNLGVAYKNLGNYSCAISCFNHALTISPTYIDALKNLGLTYETINENQKSILSFGKILDFDQNNIEAIYNIAVVKQKVKLYKEATDLYLKILKMDPCHKHALNNLGVIHHALNDLGSAVVYFSNAIDVDQNFAEALCNRSGVYVQLENYTIALSDANRAIQLNNSYTKAINNKGMALHGLQCYEDAIKTFELGILLDNNLPELHCNMGYALEAMGLNYLEAASLSYQSALQIDPSHIKSRWNLSLIQLLNGDFKNGFVGYESRWSNPALDKLLGSRRNPHCGKLWLGSENIAGKKIYIRSEQGLGDVIQFSRFLKVLKERGAYVILEVSKSLLRLFSTSFDVDVIITSEQAVPDYEFYCPIMSLALALNVSIESIPYSDKYLKVPKQSVEIWRKRLAIIDVPKVGLVWSGSTIHSNDHNRSIPFSFFSKIIDDKHTFVCLQKEIRETDIDIAKANKNLMIFSDELHDFFETAALIENLDIVITVDTSVAHLSAALGKPTWLLLPNKPDWRWLLLRNDSPWYKSLRLYRQTQLNNWEPILYQAHNDLCDFIKLTKKVCS